MNVTWEEISILIWGGGEGVSLRESDSSVDYNESHQLVKSVLAHKAFYCLVLNCLLVSKDHQIFQESFQHKREIKYTNRKEETLEIQII